MIDCANHLILCALRGIGPAPDAGDLQPMLKQMPGNIFFDPLLLDAGYDSEANHVFLRENIGVESVIPARVGRPTDKRPRGKWRWLMATNFNAEDYGQRWQVESVMRMIKARQGESLTARSDAARRDELGLMAVTHNVVILLYALKYELFYRAHQGAFDMSLSFQSYSSQRTLGALPASSAARTAGTWSAMYSRMLPETAVKSPPYQS